MTRVPIIWLIVTVFALVTGCSKDEMPTEPAIHEFQLPTTIGTKWQYSFACSYEYPPMGESIRRGGTHIWQLKSKTQISDTLLLLIEASQQDSIRATYYWHGDQVPPTFDSTYYLTQTVPFTVKINLQSIIFDWPTSLKTGWPMDPYGRSLGQAFPLVSSLIQTIPRFNAPDTITVTLGPPTAVYVSGVGLCTYTFGGFTGHTHFKVSFQIDKFLSH